MRKSIVAFTLAMLAMGFFRWRLTEGERAINGVLDRATRVLSEKYQMRAVGNSVSYPHGLLTHLGLHLRVDKAMDQNEARAVTLDCAHTLLEILHADEKARSAMAHYPFRVGDLCIAVIMHDAQGNHRYMPDFWCVELTKGELSFRSKDRPGISRAPDGRILSMYGDNDQPPIKEIVEEWVEPKDRGDTHIARIEAK